MPLLNVNGCKLNVDCEMCVIIDDLDFYVNILLQLGLLYGCLVEDVITGLSIQCKGWKSVYYNPTRKAFIGLAPTTLLEALVQHKRWTEGHFQVFPYAAWHAYGKISIGLQMGYCYYNLWAPNCLATIYYSVIPSLYLLKGTSLFPPVCFPNFGSDLISTTTSLIR